MDEIIDLLTAFYNALLEKHYMTKAGHSNPIAEQEVNFDYSFFIANPDYGVPGDMEWTRGSVTNMINEGYLFWLVTGDGRTEGWDWVWYKNGEWKQEDSSAAIREDKMPDIIRNTANRLRLELNVEPSSEMSMAARLLDDEMQYEI